ncbi:MAG: pirin family protein [Candidatus Thermoplasmatota archaeon]
MPCTVERISSAPATPEGDGMVVHRAFPSQTVGRLDPFLMLDEMGPLTLPPNSRAGFPDHPHRGFETVTYLLEGEFEHRDSHGHKGRLGPGDVQWMTAGSGVLHSEMPSATLRKSGGTLHGLQLWVNLPKRDKMMPARYQEFPSASLPRVDLPNGFVRILAGRFQDAKAIIATQTPIQFLHAELNHGAVTMDVPAGHRAFAYVVRGSGTVAGKPVRHSELAVLAGDGAVAVEAGPDGIGLVLISGVPLREPVFQSGPFVMTTRDEIIQAYTDYQDGKFGTIAR